MNIEDFIIEQEAFLTELLERTSKKQREYGRNDDAFHNFKKAAQISTTGSSAKVAWEFCTKHLQSLKDILNDNEEGISVNPEVIDEKIGDIIVYMTLIRGILLYNK